MLELGTNNTIHPICAPTHVVHDVVLFFERTTNPQKLKRHVYGYQHYSICSERKSIVNFLSLATAFFTQPASLVRLARLFAIIHVQFPPSVCMYIHGVLKPPSTHARPGDFYVPNHRHTCLPRRCHRHVVFMLVLAT